MIQGRGQLTQRIKERSKDLLGYEITVQELRLMPYIQYVMTNEQHIDPRKISADERKILRKWKDAGHIRGGASGLAITREFWDIITSLVFLGYVDVSHSCDIISGQEEYWKQYQS